MNYSFVPYRLWRLRRFFVFLALVPMFSAFLASFWGEAFTEFTSILWLGSVVVLTSMAIIARWPSSVLDLMSLSKAFALILLISPLFENEAGRISVVAIVFFPVILFILWLIIGLVHLPLLASVPFNNHKIRSSIFLKMPIEEARAALAVKPGLNLPHRETSPADDTGWFDVRLKNSAAFYDEETDEYVVAYSSRIIKTTDYEHVVDSSDGSGDKITVHQTFKSVKGGTRYNSVESGTGFTVWLAFTFWLQDFGRDNLRAELDTYFGRPSPSLFLAGDQSVMAAIATLFPQPDCSKDLSDENV